MSNSFNKAQRPKLLGCASCACLMLATTAPAMAQDTVPGSDGAPQQATAAADTAPNSDQTGGGDIVVTARRKAESLQKVPLAITAITGEQLQEAGVRNVRDIAFLTPGVTINSGGAEYNSQPIIRGAVGLSGYSGVVSFMDAVPLPQTSSINVAMLDLARVEIVKGPVAALYGQNAYAGVINYVTRVPSTDHIAVAGEGTIANGGTYTAKAFVNLPVVADLLAVSVAGNYEKFGGIYKDAVNDNKTGGYEKKDIRASFNFTPSSSFTLAGSLYYGKDVFEVTPLVYATNNCGTRSTNINTLGQFTNYCGSLNFNPLEVAPEPKSGEVTGNRREVWFANLRARYDIGYGDIGLLVGYQNSTTRRLNDFTGTRNGIPFRLSNGSTVNLLEYFGADNDDEGYNAELRYTSPLDKPFRFSFGGFYQKSDSYSSTLVSLDASPVPAGTTLVDATARFYSTVDGRAPDTGRVQNSATSKSYSGFASADYDLFDGFTLSGEYRRGHADVDSFTFTGVTNPIVTIAPYTFSYNTDSYRVSAKYQITPAAMLYASVGRGVKPGGVNTRATISAERTFGSETSQTYELGFKTSFWNNRVQVNGAVFRIDASNFQINGPSDDPANNGLVVKNFGGARNDGFELELGFRPNRHFGIHGGFSYVDPKFTNGTLDFSFGTICATTPFCDQSRVVRVVTASGTSRLALNLAGLQLPRTSKITANGSVDLAGDVTSTLGWFGRIDARFEDKQYAQQDNIAWYDERFNLNLRAGVKTQAWSLTAFVNNVTDNQTPEQVLKLTRLNDFNGNLSGYLPLPRTYGVTGTINF